MRKKTKTSPSFSGGSSAAESWASSAANPDAPSTDPTPSRGTAPAPDPDPDRGGSRERIAARAYELYLQRGGAHGRETEDWLEAEREISGRSSDSGSSSGR
jgi:Protein of unknown function (DUF2934)